MTQAAAGPNEDMEIGTRIIPEEPMAIVSLVPFHLRPLPLFHISPPSIHTTVRWSSIFPIPRLPLVILITPVCDSS
jgi:hypothetical protein